MAPPLTVSEDEIDLAVTIIDDALSALVDGDAPVTAGARTAAPGD